MTFDLAFFALAVPAVILAGISKGGFGSGASFIATPILAIVLPPELAVGILLPLLMLMDVGGLKAYWGKWVKLDATRLIIGSLPGVALAAMIWTVANPNLLRFFIGLIAVGFVAFQLARARGWLAPAKTPAGKTAGLIAGATAGFTSFISHAGGPPATIYLLSRNLSKTEYQATTVLVFWAINIAKAVLYAFLDIFTAQSLLAGFYLAPAALLGTWLGVRAHNAMPENAYFLATYALLTITGFKLIFDAVT
ncbi:MAG: sulfite exporter TauE/SafE family protein [Silicimonas sp.]|nr:sulfite exporter TauE/SafE family protein [Silicimonas sp.]